MLVTITHNVCGLAMLPKLMLKKEMQLKLIELLKPEFSKDGNQFCFLYGKMPNDCVIGFGDTAALAMQDFCKNFWNSKA